MVKNAKTIRPGPFTSLASGMDLLAKKGDEGKGEIPCTRKEAMQGIARRASAGWTHTVLK